ncbi:hypothetical protein MMC29_003095 [Sticta canariensis]|nr:hypothetical protein [Sticta canariensis]
MSRVNSSSGVEKSISSGVSNKSTGETTPDSQEIIVDGKIIGSVSLPSQKIYSREIRTPVNPNRRGAEWNENIGFHMSLLSVSNDKDQAHTVQIEEIKTAPLFSAAAADAVLAADKRASIFPQFGLLGRALDIYNASDPEDDSQSPKRITESAASRLFLNVNTPWSAFICGSQGSGKSHTLSCMLEAALITKPELGRLPKPLAGLVFHYDKFSSVSSCQVCEAAYLCSSGIPVRVLVSPSNFWRMKQAYENLPGLAPDAKKPVVKALLLKETHLDVERLMKLMAVDDTDKAIPLYMEVTCRIMRQMAIESRGAPGLNYAAFKRRLSEETFSAQQSALLNIRLNLLESFMELPDTAGALYEQEARPEFAQTKQGKMAEKKWEKEQADKVKLNKAQNIWSFEPGSLTIVDLSCPFVDEAAACALFNMCLALFLESRGDVGRIIALDEAHKVPLTVHSTKSMNNLADQYQFMSEISASTFTETLLSVIRQQRHLATRVIIATQEPTISPKLLDLSSMTIVHRFTSPSWLQTLKSHLAGISSIEETSGRDIKQIFELIVNLEAGQALLFSPSTILDVKDEPTAKDTLVTRVQKLGSRYVKMRVRERLTTDGGKSILAADMRNS